MADYSSYSLDELIEVITTWPVGMPVRAMEQILAGGESAIPALAAALERWRADESRDLLWLIVLLGETRSESAIPVLIDEMQRTDEEDLARAACEGLAKIGSGSIPALLQIADSPDRLVRIYAYAALGWIADEKAFSALRDALHRDSELGAVLAQAVCDHGRPEAIPHLYDAYRACAPWQRIEFEEAIRDLHFGDRPSLLWTRNWRARYRRDPSVGTFDLGWLGVAVLVWRHVEEISKRVAPPLKSLDEILWEKPDSQGSAETCEKCGAPIELSTGVPVCPETALWVALYQARFLGEAREEGIDDLLDLCDELDDMLCDHYEQKDSLAHGQEKAWEDKREELALRRQTGLWLVGQGIADVAAGRALLLAKAARTGRALRRSGGASISREADSKVGAKNRAK